jgi:hypothetical protein
MGVLIVDQCSPYNDLDVESDGNLFSKTKTKTGDREFLKLGKGPT